MKILVINTGSSSIKYELFEMESREVLIKGTIERMGEDNAEMSHVLFKNGQKHKTSIEGKISNHEDGLKKVVGLLTDKDTGSTQDTSEISAIGHRVVHGGEVYSGPARIDAKLKETVKELIPLAPLHNPANLQGIEVAERFFPDAVQVAVFDTAFHQTMKPATYRYPLPNMFYDEHKIRAYGFHGTSHAYVSNQMFGLLDKPKEETAIITVHLGNGCSMAAIKGGKCVDTSMGLSPLGGLMMGTRSGDIDPSIPFFMGTKLSMGLAEIDKVLNKESRLKGIAGSNDMRDVLAKRAEGDSDATLAIDMYVHRVKKFIGAYAANMGALDAIIFTAGIGENSVEIRQLVCENLGILGVSIDEEKNKTREPGNRNISDENSTVPVWIIPTNEELQIALRVEELLA